MIVEAKKGVVVGCYYHNKPMTIERALEILKNKNDYIVPNSDMDEAIQTAIDFIENKLKEGD